MQPHLGEVVGTPCLGGAEAFADVIGFAAVVQKMQYLFNEWDDVARGWSWEVCSCLSVAVLLFCGVGAHLLLSLDSVLCNLQKWPWRVLHLRVPLV